MADEKRDQERADRNHERSEEAHWQVAESGAEEEAWEDEGGAVDRELGPTREQSADDSQQESSVRPQGGEERDGS